MTAPLRFLLDNNFPEVDVLDPHQVDRTVVYEHIREWRPDLVAGVPDWLIYFEAELDGFTGIVTHDWSQSVQREEAFAITQTKLVVVTWKENPPDDPVVSWALVIAYMPEIKRVLATRRDAPFIFLPSPHLDNKRSVRKGSEALGKVAADLGISNEQARHDAKAAIVEHLQRQGLRQELFDLAERKSRRWAPGSKLAARRSATKATPSPPAPPLPTS